MICWADPHAAPMLQMISSMTKRSSILLGAGGHAAVVAATARALGWPIAGMVAREKMPLAPAVPFLGDDSWLAAQDPQAHILLNGLGFVPNRPNHRHTLQERFEALGFVFPALVHPQAYVAEDVILEPGAQIMAGALVQVSASIGRGAIINSGAIVEHHCVIGDFAHVAPGAVLCGDVTVGVGAFIGAGAIVTPGVGLSAGQIVKAGERVSHKSADIPGL